MKSTSAVFNPDALEREVLARWDAERTFEASVERRAGDARYTFYDGPPYATGLPHYGHILQTTIKDAITRYWTMRGFRVDRRVGWDCHGLPVENLVEKELGIKNKKEIEALGVEAFNAACRASVFRAVGEFQEVLKRVGRWADYANAYATLDPAYMESVWWVFKQAWDRGLVYHGLRSSPYCPRCATPLSNFETALGYREVTDPAVTVKLACVGMPSTFLLVWTTTPWTLPGNVAVAVHPELPYVKARVGGERFILAKDRLAAVLPADAVVEEEIAGARLVGTTYVPLYTFIQPETPAYRVVAAAFVSATDGTGIVHLAPAFGEDDLATAQVENLPLLNTVDEHGRIVAAVTPWAGLFVKDADPKIIEDLHTRGLLVRNERIRHSYPFCWRCDTPLIYYATESWFIAVSKIRGELLENNAQIQWVPEHLREGRFGQGLTDAPDWAVSRRRYWGTPLPVWQCAACATWTVVGSVAELRAHGADLTPLSPQGPEKPLDLHRPYIDAVTFPCPKCQAATKRVPEVFDVWMDAGSMPYAQWHYPFENTVLLESTFPADFIAEALDQTRGWFYTLHVLATILTLKDIGLGVGKPAFTHAIVSGLVLGADGRKLSKRLKNSVGVSDVVQRFGADTLRLSLLSSNSIGEDIQISDHLLAGFYRRYTLLLFNVLSFYETYAVSEEQEFGNDLPEASERPLLDRWILARVALLLRTVRDQMDAYRPDHAAKHLVAFVEDLANWYVRRSRRRFAPDADPVDREIASATLQEVLTHFALVSAPFTPFFAEAIFRRAGNFGSPHLEDFPDVRVPGYAETVVARMEAFRDLVSAALQARALARVKVRQPLPAVVVVGETPLDIADPAWAQLLREEVNVKDVQVLPEKPAGAYVWVDCSAGYAVGVSTEITDALLQEGVLRDLIRQVQDLRKKSGLTVRDRVALSITSEEPLIRETVARFSDRLLKETRALTLEDNLPQSDGEALVELHGQKVTVRIRRVA